VREVRRVEGGGSAPGQGSQFRHLPRSSPPRRHAPPLTTAPRESPFGYSVLWLCVSGAEKTILPSGQVRAVVLFHKKSPT